MCKSQVLEKPKSRQEAKTFLSLVSGTYHQVFSSISFIKDSKVLESHLIETEVLFEKIDSKEMEYYLSLEEWKDKAGAISIQGYAGFWAQKISGSYSNIIGLPMTKTKEVLRKYGIFPNLEKRK